MNRRLNALVVGTGFGVITHLRALRQAGFEVVGLVGRDPDKTAQRAAHFGVPGAYTSLDTALAQPDLDLVAIATPPNTHCEIALAAIAAGKHVVCEKPFAKSADEAEAMLTAAESQGVVHLLGTEFRWATGQELLRRVIADGSIGEPRLATFILQLPLICWPGAEVPQWWDDKADGGGWLGAYASHIIDQIRSALGEFAGVSASLSNVADRPAMTSEDTYTIHFRLKSGVDGVLQSSAGTFGPPAAIMRVAGTKGTAWTEGDDVYVADVAGQRKVEVPDDLRLAPPVPPPAELLKTAYDMMHSTGIDLAPYTKLFEYARDRILGRSVADLPPVATFADGLAGMRVIDAVRRSSDERCWVSL
jgi:predicted dehydrogenase